MLTQSRRLLDALAEKMVNLSISLYQSKQATTPRLFFIDLKQETGRERVTQTLIDEFTSAMKMRGLAITPTFISGCYTVAVSLDDCVLNAEQTKATENARLMRA